MLYNINMENKIYKPKEFGKMINRSVITLQKWDRDGVLKAHRTSTNRRYIQRIHRRFVIYVMVSVQEAEKTLLANVAEIKWMLM